jgi:hypothetical protein
MSSSLVELGGGVAIELSPDSPEKQGLGLWTLGLAGAHWASSDEGRREVTGRRVLELGSGVRLGYTVYILHSFAFRSSSQPSANSTILIAK